MLFAPVISRIYASKFFLVKFIFVEKLAYQFFLFKENLSMQLSELARVDGEQGKLELARVNAALANHCKINKVVTR